jgi:hypothetical protein
MAHAGRAYQLITVKLILALALATTPDRVISDRPRACELDSKSVAGAGIVASIQGRSESRRQNSNKKQNAYQDILGRLLSR